MSEEEKGLLEGREAIEAVVLEGRYCLLEPLEKRHEEELYQASIASNTPHNNNIDEEGQSTKDAEERFRYLPDSVPVDREDFSLWMKKAMSDPRYMFYAVIDKSTGKVGGRQSFLRMEPTHGCVEVGNIMWGPAVARTRVATEAIFLMAKHVFDVMNYRRFEWKCNAANQKSRDAALRFGFQFEGIFRQHLIVKGKNRDTAWFSMLDSEWENGIRQAYTSWLDESNFDANGMQLCRLASFMSKS